MGEVVRTLGRVRDDVAALRRDVVVRETYDAQRAALVSDIARIDRDLEEFGRRRWAVGFAVLTGAVSLIVAVVSALLPHH
jgi:hypothetical protein